MKYILLLTLVAFCNSSPRGFPWQSNVKATGDGSVVITEPDGKQAIITKVQDSTGRANIVVGVSGPNNPTKIVHIGQNNQLDESVLEALQSLEGAAVSVAPNEKLQAILNSIQLKTSQGNDALQSQENLLQKQAFLRQVNQQQLLSNNMVTIRPEDVVSPWGVLGQPIQEEAVIQQVLPDGTVITQTPNGLVSVSKNWGPSMITQTGQISGNLLSAGSSPNNALSGVGGQGAVVQIAAKIIQKEREILQAQSFLQQQQLQLQQKQLVLQLQQAQQQQEQNAEQEELLAQQLQSKLLNPATAPSSWQSGNLQKLMSRSGQNPFSRVGKFQPSLFSSGTSGVPVSYVL